MTVSYCCSSNSPLFSCFLQICVFSNKLSISCYLHSVLFILPTSPNTSHSNPSCRNVHDTTENLNLTLTCCIRYNGQFIGNSYTRNSGPIWLDDVQCTGHERDFRLCRHRGWGKHNCSHSHDVSISCFVNSSTQYAGWKVRCRSQRVSSFVIFGLGSAELSL